MNTQLEEQLHGAMERFTDGVRVPPGLALKAYRHQQNRRLTTHAVTAAGTATVLTAGALAAAGAAGAFGTASGHPVPATYTAYVISHVEHALAPPRIGSLVEADRTVFRPGATLQPFPDALVGSAGGAGAGAVGGRFTSWVNPVNYLPVRASLVQRQTDFHWLAATPAHLAQLKVAVPAGFRQVPAPVAPAAHAR